MPSTPRRPARCTCREGGGGQGPASAVVSSPAGRSYSPHRTAFLSVGRRERTLRLTALRCAASGEPHASQHSRAAASSAWRPGQMPRPVLAPGPARARRRTRTQTRAHADTHARTHMNMHADAHVHAHTPLRVHLHTEWLPFARSFRALDTLASTGLRSPSPQLQGPGSVFTGTFQAVTGTRSSPLWSAQVLVAECRRAFTASGRVHRPCHLAGPGRGEYSREKTAHGARKSAEKENLMFAKLSTPLT